MPCLQSPFVVASPPWASAFCPSLPSVPAPHPGAAGRRSAKAGQARLRRRIPRWAPQVRTRRPRTRRPTDSSWPTRPPRAARRPVLEARRRDRAQPPRRTSSPATSWSGPPRCSCWSTTSRRRRRRRVRSPSLRALLGKTTDLNQIESLETEISRRQSDLDSLQAQLNALDKKVAMSTVTATLVTAANVVVPQEDGTGFLGGLRAGWKAFLGASIGLLTVVGAVLPFVVLLALVTAPVIWWWRRRSTRRQPQTGYASWAPPATGSGGTGGSGPDEGPG